MKRIALAVLTVALIQFLLVGCIGPTIPTATSASPTSTDTVVAVGVWEQLSSFNGNVSYLAVDPLNPQTLYAGTVGSGVFKSSDGGVNWTASSSGLTSLGVWCLLLDPSNPQTLYAGTEGGEGGVLKSSDSGANWIRSSNGLTSPAVVFLAIDPSNPQTLYAGTEDGWVFQSNDGGESWTASSSGLPNDGVGYLTIDPSGILYAMTAKGVFRMTPKE